MYALEHSGALKWSKKTGMMIWTAALVSPDQNWMAFGSLDGKLYLVDPNTGIEVAEPYDCKADIKSSPTTDGKGNIFFGNSSGDVVSLRVAAHSGKTKYALHLNWKYQTGREVYSSPTYADGKVLLGTVNGNFYALDASLGTVKWQFKAYSQILSSPLVTRDKVVIFGAKNGKVYALNLTDGERIWSYRATLDSIKSNLDSSPSLDQTGMIHVGSYNGRIYHIPYEFCLTHKTNLDRCEFGGTKDSPAFEYPKTQANLATVVWIPSQLNRSFNSSSALQMRLIVTDRGEFVENAAIDAGDGKVEVEITPHVELAKQVSSDGKYLNLIPKTFFTPNTSYKIKISGLFYRQSHNWFLDRMNPSNWIGRERFEAEETFQIKPSRAEPFSTADEDTTITWGLKSMYLLQPEALDTYTPAALDGQGFLVTAFGFNPQEQKMMMLAIPAIPEHDGTEERFTLLPEPSKIYTINGSYQKDNLRGIGSFTLAAMGGEMPLNPLHFSASIHPQTGNLEGQMHSRSSCLAIKGNGAKYNFPFSLINQLCDPYGYINTMGLFKAYRLPNQNLDVKVSHFNHTSPHEVEIGLQLPHLEGSHLVTLVQYDAKTVKALSHVTEIIKADPSQKSSTWSTRFKLKEECLGCCRRNRAHPIEIFFDQQRLNLADAPECPTTGDNRNP
jgi:hypothetical protein